MLCTIIIAALCRMSQCHDEAMEKSNFCERHTCATEGCNKAVKVGGLPGWAQQKQPDYFVPGQQQEKREPPRVVWYYCNAHACNRFCPRINEGAGQLFANLSEDALLEKIACKNERLNKGKFCKEHTCHAPNCMNQTLESMPKASVDEPLTWDKLSAEAYCRQHTKLKGKDHPKKSVEKSETVSERIQRLREEKEAKAASAGAASSGSGAASASGAAEE